MCLELTPEQERARDECRAFVDRSVAPNADRYDREERLPPELIIEVARRGHLAAALPAEWGGGGLDLVTVGLLTEEIGRGCSSLRSLLTVQGMVGRALARWGTTAQRETWLGRLAAGETIAALALTEPEVGSDAAGVRTVATARDAEYILNGRKKWISFGQIADLYLVLARCGDQPTAFLVERDTAGLSIEPIGGLLGARASLLAALRFDACRIPQDNLVGRVGSGFSHVVSCALDYGRYSVAWGCVGLGRACLEASLRYADRRQQFGAPLRDHQLIRRLITDMVAGVEAARLLCYRAGCLANARDPRSIMATSLAKYFASTMAMRVASDAVQIHGASGCSDEYPVARFLRDAKVMEIIEGSTQLQQISLAEYAYQEYASLLDT